MTTITEVNNNRKPAPQAFYAHLFDEAGVLAKVNGELVFFSAARPLTTVEPSMVTFLTVLGEVGLADTQQLMAQLHGGYAAVACGREQEVR